MLSRLKRIGSTPVKYQFALVLKELKLSLPLDNMEILCIWTRGPHRCKSLPAISASNGAYVWDYEDQKKAPMMLNCTLYRESEKKSKDKDKRSGPASPSTSNGGSREHFLPKTCDITIKQSLDNGTKTKTIGVVTIDLSQHALGRVYSKDFELPADETKNITAKLSFTLHSRPLTAGPQADVDTMSTMEGMDHSYIDNDSIADFGSAARAHGSNSDDDDDDDDDAGGFGTAKGGASKKKGGFISHAPGRGLDSVSDDLDDSSDSDDDLESPDAILSGFGKSTTPTSTTGTAAAASSTGKPRSESMSTTKQAAKQQNGTSTTLGTNGHPELSREASISRTSRVYDTSPEPSISRKSTSGFGIFKSKDKERDKERAERMRQLEKQILLSEHVKDELDEEVVHLRNELRRERDKSQSLEQELALHDRKTKEIIDGANLQWGTQVAELEVEIKSLRNRINEMELQHDKRLNEALRAQSEEHSRMMVIGEQERTQMKRELEQLRARKLLFDKIPTPRGNNKANDELEIAQSRLRYYEQQLNEADVTIDDVRNTYHDINTVLMNEVRTLEELISKLRSHVNDTQMAVKEANSKSTVLEAQVKRYNDSRIKMSEIINKMEVHLSEKDERIAKVNAENDELRVEMMKLKKQLSRYQQG